jgi:hypothetical protein
MEPEAGAMTLDKSVLEQHLALEKEWNKVIILDNKGEVILTQKTSISAEEIE